MGLCVFKEGGGVGLPGGGEGLQRDVGGLSGWAEGGGMGFNQAKWWVLLEDCGGERLEDRGAVTGGLEWLEDQGAERLEDHGVVSGGLWVRMAGGPWAEWLEDCGAVTGGPWGRKAGGPRDRVSGGPSGRKAGGPKGRVSGGPWGSQWRTVGQKGWRTKGHSVWRTVGQSLEDRGAVSRTEAEAAQAELQRMFLLRDLEAGSRPSAAINSSSCLCRRLWGGRGRAARIGTAWRRSC